VPAYPARQALTTGGDCAYTTMKKKSNGQADCLISSTGKQVDYFFYFIATAFSGRQAAYCFLKALKYKKPKNNVLLVKIRIPKVFPHYLTALLPQACA